MPSEAIPENLKCLHTQEEQLREKALALVKSDDRLSIHLFVVESAMDLADVLRQFETDEEDMKVVQILGMRMFNAFGASLKLALSGYVQNSTLIMRDVLETVFLLDLFKTDRNAIKRWRFADKRERMKEFAPVKVRDALDKRDGFKSGRRTELYAQFSELAGHPSMKSVHMMCPEKGSDAVIGPFMEATALEAVLSEMGRLAIQAGEHLAAFFPPEWGHGKCSRDAFTRVKLEWIGRFYPQATSLGER
ncbi:MAG: hypothetical protein RIE31_11970 [Alphaproteobacteria bacterium]